MADTSERSLDQAISQQIDEIENMISIIEQKAKEAEKGSLSYTMMSDDIANLHKLVKSLGKPPTGQSTNHAFASVDTLESNARLAEDILNKLDVTRTTVDRLASEGRRFNASAARMDLHVIATGVHNVLTNTDLAMPYVTADLKTLADRTDHIHGLFAEAK
jgi:septation ring formation regulator EzrA